MAAKVYLYKNAESKWITGGMHIVGETVTIISEYTLNVGDYRRYTRTINGIPYVSVRHKDNNEYIIENVKISELSKDAVGTAYSSLAEFKTLTLELFLSQNVTLVDSAGNSINGSGEPRILSCEYARPSNTNVRPAYGAINETISVIKELLAADSKQAANVNGGGGVVINGSIVSNNTADVGRQFGIIFLREDISPIIADNAVQTMLYANQGKRIMVVYATMESQSAGSDVVIGRFNLPFEYQCKADSKALKALLFDVTGGTTASDSKYMVSINVQVQK